MWSNTLAILIPMILGFLGVVLSTNSMVNSAVRSMASSINRRIDDFRADMDARFTEQEEEMNRRFDDVDRRFVEMDRRFAKEIGQLDKSIGKMRTRFDTYVDAFAIRLSSSRLRNRTLKRWNP